MRKRSPRVLLASLLVVAAGATAQQPGFIELKAPNTKRGLAVMEALSVRASVREWSEKELSLQDLSDLLWAANGVNRPDSGKRTAPSAMNAQDVDIFVFTKDGAYLYDAARHALTFVTGGDRRAEIAMRPGGGPVSPPPGGPTRPPGAPPAGGPPGPSAVAPVLLVLVSDTSRFPHGTQELKMEWAALDNGIVSQNISLFCAGTGLATRPRASMNKDLIRSALGLRDTQVPMLNHPVGYPKGTK